MAPYQRGVMRGGDRGSGIGDRGSGIGDRGSGIGDRGSGIGEPGIWDLWSVVCDLWSWIVNRESGIVDLWSVIRDQGSGIWDLGSDWDLGSGIRDPWSVIRDLGSGIVARWEATDRGEALPSGGRPPRSRTACVSTRGISPHASPSRSTAPTARRCHCAADHPGSRGETPAPPGGSGMHCNFM